MCTLFLETAFSVKTHSLYNFLSWKVTFVSNFAPIATKMFHGHCSIWHLSRRLLSIPLRKSRYRNELGTFRVYLTTASYFESRLIDRLINKIRYKNLCVDPKLFSLKF